MEFEDLSTEVEREVQRVTAAFGLKSCSNGWVSPGRDTAGFRGFLEEVPVDWYVNISSASLTFIEVGDSDGVVPGVACRVSQDNEGQWWFIPHKQFNPFMARGLYCLGFEAESVLDQLPPLSMHEKLELRLSLPREFWPQKWLDEEKASGDL